LQRRRCARSGGDKSAGYGGAPAALQNEIVLANCLSGRKQLLRVEYVGPAAQTLDIESIDALNAIDANEAGGVIQGNIAEDPLLTFKDVKAEDYRLNERSACVNGGADLSSAQGLAGSGPVVTRKGLEISADFSGKPRPAPEPPAAARPARGWDIGAFELTP
jgi:hypothetical protein